MTRLAQVLANLLNNAAKYTDEGGQIWLDVWLEGGEIVVRVRDTGPGISRKLLPHVFDLFTQAERTLDRAQGGLGVGLTVVAILANLKVTNALIALLVCSVLIVIERGLDVIQQENVHKLVQEVSAGDEESTVIIVTHDVSAAVAVADTIWLMAS